MDFKAINKAALAAYPGILYQWLPGGHIVGNEYQCADLTGGKGSSLSVNIKKGMWADFAAGDSGGDAISLYAAINRMSQGDAGKALADMFGGADYKAPPKQKEAEEIRVIQPAPNPAPESAFRHWKFGKPAKVWTYKGKNGELMGYVCRFELENGDKETWPLVYTEKGWKWKSFIVPRSLYNLDILASMPNDRQILIVEGEKCADAAMQILPNQIAIAWPGGGKAAHLAEWRLLAGRDVIIWPDRDRKKYQGNHERAGEEMDYIDQPGTVTALKIAEILHNMACGVRILDVSKMDVKDGWDIADAVESGWTKKQLLTWMKENITKYEPAPDPELPPQEQPKKSNVTNIRMHPQASAKPATEKKKKEKRTAVTDTNKMSFPPGEEWRRKLLFRDTDTLITKSVHNAITFLSMHPQCREVFWFNAFTRNIEMRKCPFWRDPKKFTPGPLQDTDDTDAKAWLESHRITVTISETRAAIAAAAAQSVYNPLQEWLDGINWDNESRVDTWLSTYLGVEDTEYSRAVGRRFLIGAVARALNPGCKMDTMLILEGPQGLKKSTAIEILFSEPYFTDEIQGVGSKDTAMQMLGRWVIEVAELDALERAEVKAIKAWMSRKTDKFRPPYGRSVIEQPRSCVLFGTLNPEGLGYLRDATGGRRFWPVKCGKIDIDALMVEREQIWAEAVVMYKNDEQWWLTEEEVALATTQQEDRYEHDAWAEDIDHFVSGLNRVTTADIIKTCLEIPKERKSRATEMRIGKHLTQSGWVRKKVRQDDGKNKWYYLRDTKQQTLDLPLNKSDDVPL